MLAFLRRWRERRARTCIALAIGEQHAYEDEHAERQAKRLARIKHDRHGQYDADQRALSVEIKVRAAYLAARKKPPKNLKALVAQALQ